jgi:hypothetical protein
MRTINVTPTLDTLDHTQTADCDCDPRVDDVANHGLLIVHRGILDRSPALDTDSGRTEGCRICHKAAVRRQAKAAG